MDNLKLVAPVHTHNHHDNQVQSTPHQYLVVEHKNLVQNLTYPSRSSARRSLRTFQSVID
ncbi:hypothetical protein M378DRAFT_167079, partial [Amanita muscaria Koide BX008]